MLEKERWQSKLVSTRWGGSVRQVLVRRIIISSSPYIPHGPFILNSLDSNAKLEPIRSNLSSTRSTGRNSHE